jgi:hypothetical protein
MWGLVMASSLLVLGLLGYGLWRQLLMGLPWGVRPMSDERLILVALAGTGLSLALPLAFRSMRLVVRVRPERLHIRYLPFVDRRIPLDRIERWESRLYNPVRDYGGWGIRRGGEGRGTAYSVSGNFGVHLEMKNGERLLIGSLRADDLVRALDRARESASDAVSGPSPATTKGTP